MRWFERIQFWYVGIYFAPFNWQLRCQRGQIAVGPVWLDWCFI